jgi:hypothetical protein
MRLPAAALALFLVTPAFCQQAAAILTEAQRRAHSASVRYQGSLETFTATGRSRAKELIFERSGPRGAAKIRIRLLAPEDLKGMEVFVLGKTGQWLWNPASQRARRISAFEIRLMSADFNFADLEESDLTQFTGKVLQTEAVDGVLCWKLELHAGATEPSPYSRSLVWIRRDTYAVSKVENYAGERVARRILNRDFRQTQGIWTPYRVEVAQPDRKSGLELRLTRAEYNVAFDDANFVVPAPPESQGCAYMVQPQSATAPAEGFSGTVIVTTRTGCDWRAASDVEWLTILAGSGNGRATGAVAYRVSPNPTARARSATIAVGDRKVTVAQSAAGK